MSSRCLNDNPRLRALNRQASLETESNIRIDGLIEDASIRFPFQRNEQGLFEFSERQLFCCDSKLAVLVADPGVQVTVMRRWDLDEVEGSMAQEEAYSTTMTTEASAITAKGSTSTLTTSNVQSSETTWVQETDTRKEGFGESSTTTTKLMPGDVVASTPNLSAESQSYVAMTQGIDQQMASLETRTQNGLKYKTTAQIELSHKIPTKTVTTEVVSASTSATKTERDAPIVLDSLAAGETQKAPVPQQATEKTATVENTTVSSSAAGATQSAPVSQQATEKTATVENTVVSSSAAGATQSAAVSQQATEKTVTVANTTVASSQTTEDLRLLSFSQDGEMTIEEMLERFTVYSRSTQFMESSVETVMSMLEDDRLCIRSERDAFRAVNEWILYDPATRKEHAIKLMSAVRFSLMTLQEMIKVVHNSRYLFTMPEYRDMLLEAFIWRVASHLGNSSHFLDFEPKPRRCESRTQLSTCQCPCHGGPNTSAQCNEGVDDCSSTLCSEVASCRSSDTFVTACNREPDLCSRAP